MITAGVDVGSTAAKAVILKDNNIIGWAMLPTGWSPKKAGRQVMDQAMDMAGVTAAQVQGVVGTGYGRISLDFIDKAVTEITCHGMGANYYFPENGMVIDIGGQDSKIIVVNARGKVLNFLMNDKCAYG